MPRVKQGPRRVVVPMESDTQLLAMVAGIAVDPRCPECHGPAELRPHPRGRSGVVDLHVEHRPDCPALAGYPAAP
ncbi:hypothetical protein [Streptomyces sp. 1222.5]|uniref:hypothetical protein n=1 Tax=Streptomyces sp. 1222.5 TaxID=1881026 RepID=UPI003EBD544A